MICRSCKRDLPENSIFCCWCGERQIKEKAKEIRVPKPEQLPSGAWRVRLRAEGQSVTEDTPEKAIVKATAIRAGFLRAESAPKTITLRKAMDSYIADRTNVLSPSTIFGYKKIQRLRFQPYMDKNAATVNWQRAVNEESSLVSPKTVMNAWGLAHAALKEAGITVDVATPTPPKNERPWLDPEQIRVFLSAIEGKTCEAQALLALHSLRRSELAALTWENIDLEHNVIHVHGAVVQAEDGLVMKSTNKTTAADRHIPIMIPRLRELLEAEPDKHGLVYTGNIHLPYKQTRAACAKAGLPPVGIHGLRHSFASLGHYLGIPAMEIAEMGGWDDLSVVEDIYTHLSALNRSRAENAMHEFFSGHDD